MKDFEEFMRSGMARRQTPNRHRASSLYGEAARKKEFLYTALKSIPEEKMSANFIVDACYDILLELIRANMHADGFNVKNSHEAEVSYSKKLGFSEADMHFLDEIRYFRNGIKYYGKVLDIGYAKKVLSFVKKAYPKLSKMLAEKLKA